MPVTLVLTTDLPYFPGKMGVDFFNLRNLAKTGNEVGVVGPVYPEILAEGLTNLERFLANGAGYFWPRPTEPTPTMPAVRSLPGELAGWLARMSPARQRRWLARLLGTGQQPPGAHTQLAILANCAPHLLAALTDRSWQVLVLIQSNTAPWLDYLPAHLPRVVYFHDVRAHADALRQRVMGGNPAGKRERTAIRNEERRLARECEVIALVSEPEAKRARELLAPTAETGVAPIPVDTDYYTPPPPARARDPRPVVLFTGHLSHPPNVDAVRWFLESIWLALRAQVPGAVFRAVGCLPSAELQAAVAAAGPDVELHANVPDIRPYFWDARAYVVPMRFGGGVRQKVFEAWAMRVPVVATRMAVEGTRAESGVNCWLQDEPAAFAAAVVGLLREDNPSAATAAVCARASETVERFNSIAAAAAQFARLVARAPAIRRQRPYRLLYDLRWMEIGRAGGIEQLAFEQLDAVARLDRQNAYRVYGPRSTFSEWNFPRDFRCQGFFTDRNEAKAEALHATVANRLAEKCGEPAVLTPAMRALRFYKKLDFDLVHSVCSYIHPDLEAFPNVLTMCDLQHVHLPGFFSEEELRTRQHLYERSSRRARHVICISEHTRQDLHRTYGIPLEKMTTVWVIPSRAAWTPLPPGRARALLRGMGLEPGRFFFFPAHPWAHKNHARLLEALALVAKDLPADVRLVLTGRAFPPDHPARVVLAADGGRLEKRVVHLGYRSSLEIRALYGGALALVFPSLFEGFGMPVAEAMIAGCPVACANTTSLPEIAGDAAALFDPQNVSDIAATLLRLGTDAGLRDELRAAGTRRRGMFSARDAAVKTLSVYRQAFEEYYAV